MNIECLELSWDKRVYGIFSVLSSYWRHIIIVSYVQVLQFSCYAFDVYRLFYTILCLETKRDL